MAKYQEWIDPDGLLLISAWARDGLTLDQIAGNMGIGLTTLYDWRGKYEEIANALKRSRELADIEVENALYKRAMGYDYVEITREESAQGTKVKEVTKHVSPDVTAQIFWLKNRKPDVWRDRRQEDNKEDNSGDTGVVEVTEVKGDA